MNDCIRIHELEVQTHIGVPEEERLEEQKLLVSVDLYTDISKTVDVDDLSGTIDYESVANKIKEISSTERNTLERFVEDVAQTLIDEFKPEKVTITAKKFALPDTKGVSITITRS